MAKELEQKNIVLEQYEKELKQYRAEAFATESYQGIRKYSHELIDLLKHFTIMDSDKLIETLGIDPTDSEITKAISSELENLEAYGLIISTPRGWKWQG
jgi:hypothetical protein